MAGDFPKKDPPSIAVLHMCLHVSMHTLYVPYVHPMHLYVRLTCTLRASMHALHMSTCTLCAPYVCLMCTLRAPTHVYVHLTCVYACLTCIYACLTCTLHMPYVHVTRALCASTHALQVYDWLRVPTQPIRLLTFKNLINIKS